MGSARWSLLVSVLGAVFLSGNALDNGLALVSIEFKV